MIEKERDVQYVFQISHVSMEILSQNAVYVLIFHVFDAKKNTHQNIIY
jgi:hypothetical protein